MAREKIIFIDNDRRNYFIVEFNRYLDPDKNDFKTQRIS